MEPESKTAEQITLERFLERWRQRLLIQLYNRCTKDVTFKSRLWTTLTESTQEDNRNTITVEDAVKGLESLNVTIGEKLRTAPGVQLTDCFGIRSFVNFVVYGEPRNIWTKSDIYSPEVQEKVASEIDSQPQVTSATTRDFLHEKFEQDELRQMKEQSTRPLVMGMGGGCDVFSAYTLAKKINGAFSPESSEDDAGNVLYANCISERKNGIPDDHLTLVEKSLYAVPPGPIRPLVEGENTYGTTFLEQSVPRGAENSPLLFEVIGHKKVETKEDVNAQTDENVRRLHAAWDHLQVDLVLAVDTGGDSLTGGKDWKVDKVTGRDQQVLNALRRYKHLHPNFKFMHIVLGPGCDAETPEKLMIQEVWRAGEDQSDLPWCKGRKYLGCFTMEDMIPATFEMVKVLAPNRTPFIMYRALTNTEEYHLDRPGPEDEGYVADRDCVKIERHGNYEVIPRHWLFHGLAFEYSDLSEEINSY